MPGIYLGSQLLTPVGSGSGPGGDEPWDDTPPTIQTPYYFNLVDARAWRRNGLCLLSLAMSNGIGSSFEGPGLSQQLGQIPDGFGPLAGMTTVEPSTGALIMLSEGGSLTLAGTLWPWHDGSVIEFAFFYPLSPH